MKALPFLLLLQLLCLTVRSQNRRVGPFTEVYAWKQMTFNINGNILTQDRVSSEGLFTNQNGRQKRQIGSEDSYFGSSSSEEEGNFRNNRQTNNGFNSQRSSKIFDGSYMMRSAFQRPAATDDSTTFFRQYNNVPMGAEKYGNRLFIALPRRRYGIPATLNYIDLSDSSRSPHLSPYPSMADSTDLVSVYRTRADSCQRLWMVDTGLLELPVNPQQLQTPAIVIYDLRTDRQILRYNLKDTDVIANNTPTGLASITVDTSKGCNDAYAYIPDLTTNGIVVFSLRERDSWRLTHNYLHFNPTASSLNVAGQRFQWNDGIFSITLGPPTRGCRTAYFHPLISTQEFSVSTCTLNNRTASEDRAYWERFTVLGERGPNTQSTMHDLHRKSGVIFFADIGRDGVSCWHTSRPMSPENVVLLAQDVKRMSYPADLHVTDNEVWVIANTLPGFGYATLDTNEYNFYVYKGNVHDMTSGTRCASNLI